MVDSLVRSADASERDTLLAQLRKEMSPWATALKTQLAEEEQALGPIGEKYMNLAMQKVCAHYCKLV